MESLTVKERWVLRLYAGRRRLRRLPVIGFSEALTRTGRLLICLPADPEEARRASEIIPDLITCLQAASTIVLGEPSAIAACAFTDEDIQIIAIEETDRRWTGAASSELVQRVAGSGLNVAVDLSPHMELLTSTVCMQSRAQMRFCFHGPYRDLFFNIQIVLNDRSPESEIDTPPPPEDMFSSAPGDTPYVRLLHTVQRMTGHASSPQESA